MKSVRRDATFPVRLLGGMRSRDALWLTITCLMLVVLLLPIGSYIAAISLIQDEWGLNNTEAGAIYSAYLAGYAVSALVIVPMTDRLGSRYIFIGFAILSVLSHALFARLAVGIGSAIVLMAIAGMGLAGVYMPGLRVVSERFPTRWRGASMGMFVTAYYAATSVSLAATGGLMAWLEWRDAYLVMALASIASLPIAYALFRGHRDAPDPRSSGRLDLMVLKNRVARYFILGYSLHASVLFAVRVWLPRFLMAALVARGIDTAEAAVAAAAAGAIALAPGAIGPLMGGIISDRWGRASSAAAILTLSAACSLAIGWLSGFPLPVIVAVGLVYGWAIAADSAIHTTAITEVASPDSLGSTMAVQAFIGFGGGVVGPILVGGVLDVSPESIKWRVGFSLLALLSVMAAAAMLRLRTLGEGHVVVRGRR